MTTPRSKMKRIPCITPTPKLKTPGRIQRCTDSHESVQVFCRVRPPAQAREISCIKVISNTDVELMSQELNRPTKKFTFKKIFAENSSQKELFDEVALPLVAQLVNGGNGLLFTYGVTDSGKTYTMTGKKENIGIMPRCLDVVFNSINSFQAGKFIFKPDRMNGFDIQTDDEAERDRIAYSRKNANSISKRTNSHEDLFQTNVDADVTEVTVNEEDNAFAVFVTYIEVYNNFVYDLLDNAFESKNGPKLEPSPKTIRDPVSGKTYVEGVNEVQVATTQEALEIFYLGSRRKRMACTKLNDDSSRSHSIFTIRVVQAPLDEEGKSVYQDERLIVVSQLSLVDLAGSERANRTQNTGQRLTEAGNINNSLMGLRECLKKLRLKQQSAVNSNEVIPYREHKITYLFKSFFEGDGDIRMIVCVNPRKADAEENASVLQFAETTKEIMVPRTPISESKSVRFTPGRRKLPPKLLPMSPVSEEDNTSKRYEFEPSLRREDFANDEDYIKAVIERLQNMAENYDTVKLNIFTKDNEFREELVRIKDYLETECALWKQKYEKENEKCKELEKENSELRLRLELQNNSESQRQETSTFGDTSSNLIHSRLRTQKRKSTDENYYDRTILERESPPRGKYPDYHINSRTAERPNPPKRKKLDKPKFKPMIR